MSQPDAPSPVTSKASSRRGGKKVRGTAGQKTRRSASSTAKPSSGSTPLDDGLRVLTLEAGSLPGGTYVFLILPDDWGIRQVGGPFPDEASADLFISGYRAAMESTSS